MKAFVLDASRLGLAAFLVGALLIPGSFQAAASQTSRPLYDFPSSPPYSEFIELPESGLTTPFCAEWNPDFPYRGGQCCAKVPRRGSNSDGFCSAARAKGNFCDEVTEEQQRYIGEIQSNPHADILELIKKDGIRKEVQANCSPNNGFLAFGRPVVPTLDNRIVLKSPYRCTYFGTDAMTQMLEWVGRRVADQYKDVQSAGLVLGDISAPRGGCLKGQGGKRGHKSHTSGQDVDVGFLTLRGETRAPAVFHKHFEASENWWLIKQVFSNPFACVKVIFLDRGHIARLRKYASGDPDWGAYSSHIKHVRNHKNHFHVRIGDGPGSAGCVKPDASGDALDVEDEEEG